MQINIDILAKQWMLNYQFITIEPEMDLSVARRIPMSDKNQRVSTEEIKTGLERIKKAQQQVLEELRRNHLESLEIDPQINLYRNSSQMYQLRSIENDTLKRELSVERERSNEKSTLYRRRVVDLESSLALHSEKQQKLKAENLAIREQLRRAQQEFEKVNAKLEQLQKTKQQSNDYQYKFKQLEIEYEKLIVESEKSTKNVRNLEQQILSLQTKIETNEKASQSAKDLSKDYEKLLKERDSLMSQKIQLLKKDSKLQSENIAWKQKFALLQKQQDEKEESGANRKITGKIISELNKINKCHETTFFNFRSGKSFNRLDLENEESYQNSLNKIVQLMQQIQKGSKAPENESKILEDFKFQNEEMGLSEKRRLEEEFKKKAAKQALRFKSEKEDWLTKINRRDKEIQRLKEVIEENQGKMQKLREEKAEYLKELSQMTSTLEFMKKKQEETREKKKQQFAQNKEAQEKEYQSIIQQLNDQMETIKKQKRNLDGLVNQVTDSKLANDQKSKKKLTQIVEVNERIKSENQKILEKYEAILVEKDHMYLSMRDKDRKVEDLLKKIAAQVLSKEKLFEELMKEKKQVELLTNERDQSKNRFEIFKNQMKSQRIAQQKVSQNYRSQVDGLRRQLQIGLEERKQFRLLKGQYETLMKDNSILGKKAWHVNTKVEHLWMIKETEYQNVNQILLQMLK